MTNTISGSARGWMQLAGAQRLAEIERAGAGQEAEHRVGDARPGPAWPAT